ncbi:MAG: hypothetical protein V7635_1821, partial [Arthrobacter sp.]
MATTAETGPPQPEKSHGMPPGSASAARHELPRQPGRISKLGIAAVVVTVVLWASAF